MIEETGANQRIGEGMGGFRAVPTTAAKNWPTLCAAGDGATEDEDAGVPRGPLAQRAVPPSPEAQRLLHTHAHVCAHTHNHANACAHFSFCTACRDTRLAVLSRMNAGPRAHSQTTPWVDPARRGMPPGRVCLSESAPGRCLGPPSRSKSTPKPQASTSSTDVGDGNTGCGTRPRGRATAWSMHTRRAASRRLRRGRAATHARGARWPSDDAGHRRPAEARQTLRQRRP